MDNTRIHFDLNDQIAAVDPRLFGGFLEHLGRAVYQGVFDPTSVHADAHGFRKDVMSALNRLGMTVMRYPGGNFASGYHWQDGIGSLETRPVRKDHAWHSLEPNTFGTDEFMRLCKKMKWQPMFTVNLGTGSPEEARNWLEYCNAPVGSQYADLRVKHGSRQPHDVKLWCLGNEMDGYWQLGHVPVEDYSLRAKKAAKMMKAIDPSIEVVVCGSSNPWMSTFLDWDRQVLEITEGLVDYISLHCYVGNSNDDTLDYLAITNTIDRQIEAIDGVCRSIQTKRKSPQRAFLSFDEWNVWYKNMDDIGKGQFAPHLFEEVYNLEDALVVAGFLQSFIRHADVVKIANLAQIVNVIAPIQTKSDELLIQTIFYPFEMISRRKNGISLQPLIKGPKYVGKSNGEVTFIDCAAILDKLTLHIFITNRNPHDSAPIVVDLASGKFRALENAEILTGPDAKASNSFNNPGMVKSQPFQKVEISDGELDLRLPPLSFSALSLAFEKRK